MDMSDPELDLRPEFNSGRPGLNLGHIFTVDPTHRVKIPGIIYD